MTCSSDRRTALSAFGLNGTTIALKARAGCLTVRDRLGFAMVALEWVAEEPAARAAVIDFLNEVEIDAAGAGLRLQQFLDGWMADLDPYRPEIALAALESEAEQAGWATRKDCGHD
ncbi:hypothetical protein [Citreimonas sp.]|uniref:hypothetical protein n=1 Tax=Citreimonas sp. TaxID=3036715 RepID=UPI004059F4DB